MKSIAVIALIAGAQAVQLQSMIQAPGCGCTPDDCEWEEPFECDADASG